MGRVLWLWCYPSTIAALVFIVPSGMNAISFEHVTFKCTSVFSPTAFSSPVRGCFASLMGVE